MNENKSEQYTFAPEEKQILEILASFEKELGEKLQESKSEVERVKYYEKFQINGIDFNNIFTTTEKDVDGNVSYHVYSGNSSNEILSIDSEGKIKVIPELEAFLGDIDIEKIMLENEKEPGKLKGISEKMKPEEMKKALKGEKTNQEQGQQNGENTETQQVEKDIQEQGEDLGISNYRKIKDPQISKRIPEAFDENAEEIGTAYSNKLNKFVNVEKVNGKYKLNENIEPAKTTWKTVISIDENGEKIEKKVPHALMKVRNNDKKEMAINIGQYGDADLETVDVLPCNERIARGVRMQGEGLEKEESYQIRREFETEGKEYSHELAHEVNEVLERQTEEASKQDYDITEKDYIPNTQMTWGELMEETGDSLPVLVERYNREMAKEGADSEKVVAEIEEDYGNVSHERNKM